MEKANELQSQVREIEGLSTIPLSMTRIMLVADDPKATANDLAQEIASDQSLTAKILQIVNSAFYGFRREISSVTDAVVILGFNQVRHMATAVSVFGAFQRGEDRLFDRQLLWRHSLACAMTSNALTIKSRDKYPDEKGGHTAGLLHDIGKVVLDQYFHDKLVEVMVYAKDRSAPLIEAEQTILGATHADVGGWLADSWGFPVTLVESIKCHHAPHEAHEPRLLPFVTHASNAVCNALGYAATDTVEHGTDVDEEARQAAGITRDSIRNIQEQLEKNAAFLEGISSAMS